MITVIFWDLYTRSNQGIMGVMKWVAVTACVCAGGMAWAGPQLQSVRNIYIFPMRAGMDQYLANRLTQFGKFQIVADPKQADAILTDRLGEPLERKLDDLYKPKESEKKETAELKADAKGEAKAASKDTRQPGIVTLQDQAPQESTFGRGKGTFFIVDRRTRAVLWSVYERPRNTTADELNKTAERIVNHLKRDLKPSQAQQ